MEDEFNPGMWLALGQVECRQFLHARDKRRLGGYGPHRVGIRLALHDAGMGIDGRQEEERKQEPRTSGQARLYLPGTVSSWTVFQGFGWAPGCGTCFGCNRVWYQDSLARSLCSSRFASSAPCDSKTDKIHFSVLSLEVRLSWKV
jgi:hypothetical protein